VVVVISGEERKRGKVDGRYGRGGDIGDIGVSGGFRMRLRFVEHSEV